MLDAADGADYDDEFEDDDKEDEVASEAERNAPPTPYELYLEARILTFRKKYEEFQNRLIGLNGGPICDPRGPKDRMIRAWMREFVTEFKRWEDAYGAEEWIYLFYNDLPRPREKWRLYTHRERDIIRGHMDSIKVLFRDIRANDGIVHPISTSARDGFGRTRWRTYNMSTLEQKQMVDTRSKKMVDGIGDSTKHRNAVWRLGVEKRRKRLDAERKDKRKEKQAQDAERTKKEIAEAEKREREQQEAEEGTKE
jgi:hypothetical protein